MPSPRLETEIRDSFLLRFADIHAWVFFDLKNQTYTQTDGVVFAMNLAHALLVNIVGRLELEMNQVCPTKIEDGPHGVGEFNAVPVFQLLIPLYMSIARTDIEVQAKDQIKVGEGWCFTNEDKGADTGTENVVVGFGFVAK